MARNDLVTASPVKLTLARLLTGPVAGRTIEKATRNRIPNHGIRFDTSGPEFSRQVKAQLFWRSYESAEIRLIRRHLRDANTVVELGSSLGITSAHIAAGLRPGGTLLCVEANPRLVDGLRTRVAAHAPDVMVIVENLAVTSTRGPATLTVGDATYGSRLADAAGSPGAGSPAAGSGGGGVAVGTTTLRELLEKHAVEDFDLVSDIEGAETSFLFDDPGALAGCRRAVLELHHTMYGGRRLTPFDLMDAAEAAGLRVTEQHGPVVALTRR